QRLAGRQGEEERGAGEGGEAAEGERGRPHGDITLSGSRWSLCLTLTGGADPSGEPRIQRLDGPRMRVLGVRPTKPARAVATVGLLAPGEAGHKRSFARHPGTTL